MAFFLQLLFYWLILWGISKFAFKQKLRSHALKARISFSISFFTIGVIHLVNPESLAYMIEAYLPYPRYWILFTGFLEILLALLLFVERWKKMIGWIIIIYLVMIFPANINVAINGLNPPAGLPSTPFYVWSRLFFQPIYIAWVYFSVIKPDNNFSKELVEK